MNKVDLNKILFTEINRLKKDFPEENWYTDEELETVPEAKYIKDAMKEACRQALKLAAENAEINYPNEDEGQSAEIDKQSIKDTINQIE
jgi:hypothetical protein